MSDLFEAGLINAAVVTVLAVAVWLVTRRWRHPALVHTLWVIMLVKFITPPMVTVPLRFATATAPTWDSSTDVNAVTSIHRTDFVDHSGTQADVRTALLPAARLENPLPVPHPRPGEDFRVPADLSTSAVAPEDQTSAARFHAAVDSQTGFAQELPWATLAMSAWLFGSAVFLFVSALRMMRFHRALSNTRPVPNSIQQLAEEAATRFGLTGRCQLRVTEARLPPLVWPLGRPTIVMPRALVAELSPDEIQTLLAHELAHLRRRDHWVRWLELVVSATYWWHPVVWWARTAIQQAEEEACDAWVISALPHLTARYATALFKAAQFVSDRHLPEPILASALGSGGKLKERIEHVMNTTWKPRLVLPVRLTVLLIALLILPLSLRTFGATGEPEASQGPQVETTDDAASQSVADTTSDAVAETQATPDTDQSAAQSDAPANSQDVARNVLDEAADDDPQDGPAEATSPESSTTGPLQKIHAGTALTIRIFPTVSGNPIGDVSHVDAQGRVALGPLFGRVKLDGLTVDEAEAALLKHLESLELIREPRVQVTLIGNPNAYHRVPVQHDPYHIKARDIIAVTVSNAAPDAPIEGDFMVEPSGAVPLGPLYGRVKVAGMTFEDAEKAVAAHLRTLLKDPQVQITIGGWRGAATSFVSPTPSLPGDPLARDVDLENEVRQVEQALNNELSRWGEGHPRVRLLRKSYDKLQSRLKKQQDLDSFRSSVPAPHPTRNIAAGRQTSRQANAEELQALREHVRFLENHFNKADALYRTGSRGGSAFARSLSGYELAAAQGELALVEGNQSDAIAQFVKAEEYAEQALVAAQAAYTAYLVTDDALLEAAKSLSQIKRRLSAFRHSPTSADNVSADAVTRRDSTLEGRTQVVSTSGGTESLGVLQKIAERAKLDYDRVKELADQKAVSATELARAKSDFEISLERLRQAERGLKYHQLLLEAAEADYQMLLETNKRAPKTITEPALRKAKLAVELAKAKLEELSE